MSAVFRLFVSIVMVALTGMVALVQSVASAREAAAPGAGGAARLVPALALSVDPFFEREAVPGQELSGVIRVRNRGGAAALVRVEVSDYGQDGAGQPRLSAPGSTPLGAGAWVEVTPGWFLLGPGRERAVPVRVRVPARAATASYGAVVFFGAEGAGSAPSGSGTRVTGRLGTVVLVRVRGAAPARESGSIEDVSFPRFSLSYPVPVAVRYRNTGNVHSSVAAEISLIPARGGAVIRQEMARRRILSGSVALFQGRLASGPAAGAFRVRVRAVGEDGRTLGRPVDAGLLYVVVWQLPAGLLLAALGGLALASLRRRWAVPPGRAAPVP